MDEKQELQEYRRLKNHIRTAAIEIAPDYPNIGNVDVWEHVWAIKSSYEGTDLANQDLHALIAELGNRLGMTTLEIVDLGIKIRKKREECERPMSLAEFIERDE